MVASLLVFDMILFYRVFVGGISPHTTEAELHQLFSSYGNVKATKIIQDRAGVSKGYGFVTFETEDEARRLQNEVHAVYKVPAQCFVLKSFFPFFSEWMWGSLSDTVTCRKRRKLSGWLLHMNNCHIILVSGAVTLHSVCEGTGFLCLCACVKLCWTVKFCHRRGVARSECRRRGQRNKLCLAVALSLWIPPFKKFWLNLLYKTQPVSACDMTGSSFSFERGIFAVHSLLIWSSAYILLAIC